MAEHVGRHRRRHRARTTPLLAARIRFYVVTFLTIVAVSYVAVPFASDLAESMTTYAPKYHDPKDFTRNDYLAEQARQGSAPNAHDGIFPASLSSNRLIGMGLVVVVVVAWLGILPIGSRQPRRPF